MTTDNIKQVRSQQTAALRAQCALVQTSNAAKHSTRIKAALNVSSGLLRKMAGAPDADAVQAC